MDGHLVTNSAWVVGRCLLIKSLNASFPALLTARGNSGKHLVHRAQIELRVDLVWNIETLVG